MMDIESKEAALWSENMRLKSEIEHLRAVIKSGNGVTIIIVRKADLRAGRAALAATK